MPLNVLLADDSVPAQNMGKKILVDAGYEVATASNGLEALRKISETKPDIAILDIFMPGYTGLEICERLRANSDTATLPVILTVGKLEPYRPEDGEHVHSNAVIVKPFAAAELISAVRSLIGAPAAAASSTGSTAGQQAGQPGVDPLQNVPGDTPVASVDPLSDGHPVTGQEQAVAPPQIELEEEEPLFLNHQIPAAEESSSEAESGQSAYGAAQEPSTAELNSPAGLMFDPGAKHTPFSASAVDLLPTVAHSAEENAGTAFTEFDLEPAGATSAFASESFVSAGHEFSLSDPAATEAVPESPVAPQVAAEPIPASLDVPEHDPLLEVQESTAPEAGTTATAGADLNQEAALPPAEPESAEFTLVEPQAPLSEEDEARRLAFEALFNSPDLPPLEGYPIEGFAPSAPVNDSVPLPSMADLSKEHPFEVAHDTEIEHPEDLHRQEFDAPEPEPYLLEEEEPRSVVGAIPDRDPLLDEDLVSNWPETVGAPQSETAAASPLVEMQSPQLHDLGEIELEPPTQPAPAVEQQIPAGAEIEPLQTFELAEAAQAHEEIFEVEPEHLDTPIVAAAAEAPAPLQAANEMESPEPELLEAVPEPVHPEAELLQAEPESQPVETGPLETASEVEPSEPEPSEPELSHVAPVPDHFEPELPPANQEAVNLEEESHPAVAEVAHTAADIAVPALASMAAVEMAHAKLPAHADEPAASHEHSTAPNEVEQIHQAVEKVFDRFKPLLVAAIVRELARRD